MFKRNNIIVFGSINTDISIKGQRLPKPGETLYAETISYSGGGKGANQAIAASRLNNHDSRIEMIGSIGDDIFSKNNLEKLKTEGISVQGIRTIPNTSNGTAVIFLDEESHILNRLNLCRLYFNKSEPGPQPISNTFGTGRPFFFTVLITSSIKSIFPLIIPV